MSDIRHILFICSWYPNREAPALGNFIQQHAIAAAAHDKISVVYARATSSLPEGEQDVAESHRGNLSEYVIYYGKVRSKFPLLSKLQKRDAYRKNIRFGVEKAIQKNEKPDIVHVHVIWPAAVAVLPLLNEMNCPLVISEHWSGYLPEDGNYKGLIQKNISKQLVEKASLITVVSKQMENAMVTHGLTGKFVRLPNTVDTAVFNYKGDQQSSGMKLLHVSMLVDREKNVSGLIRAMSKLTSETNLELHIVGSGNDEAALKKLATDLRLSDRSVFFEGYKTNDEIAAMMNDSGALIMFSNFEGMPVTIIEAQCCGLPVIATKVGAIPEMIEDNKDGALIAANDEDALVNAIKFYIGKRNTFDRRSISEKAKEQYSLQHVGLKLQQIYSSILSDDAK